MTKFDNTLINVYIVAYLLALLLNNFGVLSDSAMPLVIKTVSGLAGAYFLYRLIRYRVVEKKIMWRIIFLLIIIAALFVIY